MQRAMKNPATIGAGFFDTVDRDDPRCFVQPPEVRDPLPAPVRPGRRRTRKAAGVMLTVREREVAVWLAAHCSNRDVAERLHISTRTVEHHVQSVLERFGLRSRFQVTPELL